MRYLISKITAALLMIVAIACVDESKDPVKFNEVKKATILALRGSAFDALNDTGCSNSFFKNNIIGNEIYSVDADYLSEDPESLQEVQLFAETPNIARVLVATIPGSSFTFPAGSTTKRGTVSASLTSIMSKLGLTPTTIADIKEADITMTTDLILKDGSKVLASSIVNPNLFQSVIFYPAMVLNYCAYDAAEFAPQASTKLLGEYAKNATTGVVTRTVVPLKNGVSDTLYISYDQDVIKSAPTVTFSPAGAGVVTQDVTPYKSQKNGFYVIYTAGSTFTGTVSATVSGAVANVAGVDLTQDDKTQIINVDNTPPQITANVGDFFIGKGQFITLKVTYNEAMSRKSADAIKATITGQGLEAITNATMTIAADGLSASLIYIFKPADPLVPATHGALNVSFTGGKDAAGNFAPAPNGNISVDVNAPPVPTLTASAGYDLGTQIKWSANETNPGGAQTGTVYFVAITSGELAPTGFSIDADAVATWTMAVDDTPPAGAPAGAKVVNRQTGTIVLSSTGSGNSGTKFTPFTANGTLDVYAVFVSSSGTISPIPTKPVTTTVAPATANPLTITMN